MKSNIRVLNSILDAVNSKLEISGYSAMEHKINSVFIRKTSKWAHPEKLVELSGKKITKEQQKKEEKGFKDYLAKQHCYVKTAVSTGLGKGRTYGLEISMQHYDDESRIALFFPSNTGAKSKKVEITKYKEHWTPDGEFKRIEYPGKRTQKPRKTELFTSKKKIQYYAYIGECFDERSGAVLEYPAFRQMFLIGSHFQADDAEVLQRYFDWKTEQAVGTQKWDDVGGMEEAKKVVEYSTVLIEENSELFQDEERDHILLVGPPGVGKTTLIRAMFSRLRGKANFIPYSIAATVFGGDEDSPTIAFDMLLEHMNELSESTDRWTYLFIDEIDNIAREGMHSKALLRNMDNNAGRRFSIIASTNRPDVMDFALFRSGRFSPLIYVGPPTDKERLAIWKVILERYNLNLSAQKMSDESKGFTGADINHVAKQIMRESKYAELHDEKFNTEKIMMKYLKRHRELFRVRNENWAARVMDFMATVESNVSGMWQ